MARSSQTPHQHKNRYEAPSSRSGNRERRAQRGGESVQKQKVPELVRMGESYSSLVFVPCVLWDSRGNKYVLVDTECRTIFSDPQFPICRYSGVYRREDTSGVHVDARRARPEITEQGTLDQVDPNYRRLRRDDKPRNETQEERVARLRRTVERKYNLPPLSPGL